MCLQRNAKSILVVYWGGEKRRWFDTREGVRADPAENRARRTRSGRGGVGDRAGERIRQQPHARSAKHSDNWSPRVCLEQTPNRGAVVIQLKRQDIIDLYELREALEVFAVGKVAQRSHSENEIERLKCWWAKSLDCKGNSSGIQANRIVRPPDAQVYLLRPRLPLAVSAHGGECQNPQAGE